MSKNTSIVLDEYINIKALRLILDNIEHFKDRIGKAYNASGECKFIEGDAFITLLKKYYNEFKSQNTKSTTYNQRGKHSDGELFGRYFADQGLSLQNISRQIRHTICDEAFGFDLDFKNCHPTIAKHLCEKHNIPCQYLTEYINNRDDIIKMITNTFNFVNGGAEHQMTKDEVKTMLLACLNGGKLPKLPTNMKDSKVYQFITNYDAEMKNMISKLQDFYPKYKQTAELANNKRKFSRNGYTNIGGTTCNYLFCVYENQMLQILKDEAEKLNLKVSVLAFDGLMIDSRKTNKEFIKTRLFPIVESEIKRQTGMIMKLDIKKPDQGIDLTGFKVSDNSDLFEIKNDEVINYWKAQNNIKVDESICEKFITTDFYKSKLRKYNFLCVRGNMKTGKTFALSSLKDYKSVLIITYRISLDIELAKNFGFDLYSDLHGLIDSERLVCQIDSLHRVIRDYDLVILDEATYTLSHLTNFVREKSQVLRSLQYHLKTCEKFVACDALFKKRHVEILETLSTKKAYFIDNTFKSYSDYTVQYVEGDKNSLLKLVCEKLDLGKKIVVPSNSRDALEFLKANLSIICPTIKMCVISRETEFVETSLWNQYDVVAYTPTVESGISFSQVHFDIEICYMTSNKSSAPSNFAQMMFRNRTLVDKEIYIIGSMATVYYPLTERAISDEISNVRDSFRESGLEINYSTASLNTDSVYYKMFMSLKIGENMDRTEYAEAVKQFLISHGVDYKSINDFNPVVDKDDMEMYKEVKMIYDKEQLDKIFESRNLATEDYKKLDKKVQNNEADVMAMDKYRFMTTYRIAPEEVNREMFHVLHPLQQTYSNCCMLKAGSKFMKNKLLTRGIKIENETSSSDQDQNLINLIDGSKKSLPVLKMLYAIELAKSYGCLHLEDWICENPTDTLTANYKGLVDFIKSTPKSFKTFTGSKIKLDKIDLESSSTKQQLTKLINTQISKMFGLKVEKDSGSKKKGNTSDDFFITSELEDPLITYGLNLWLPNTTPEESLIFDKTNSNDNEDIYGRVKRSTVPRRIIKARV